MVELVGGAHRPAPRRHALDRALPVPRRAHAVVLGQRREEALPLLRLRRVGRRDQVRAARPRRSTSPGRSRSLAERYNVELEREDEDPEAERRRQRRERLLKLARPRGRRTTSASSGSRPRRGTRASTWPSAGWGRRCCASSASATRRARGTAARAARSATASGAEELVAAGLGAAQPRAAASIDRFRGADHVPARRRARPGARLRRARAARRRQGPKYLNTSENELYHKGRQLFGIDRARGAGGQGRAGRRGRGLHRRARAAPGGRRGDRGDHGHRASRPSSSPSSARRRPTIYFALDADRAGQEAMARAAARRRGARIELRVVALPTGSDPADLVAEDGAEAFGELLERRDRRAGVRGQAGAGRRRTSTTPGGRDEALSAVVPVIGAVPRNTATWDHLVRYVSDRLAVDPQYLMTLLSAPRSPHAPPRPDPRARVGVPHTSRLPSIEAVASTERAFLAMCLAHGQIGQAVPRRTQ